MNARRVVLLLATVLLVLPVLSCTTTPGQPSAQPPGSAVGPVPAPELEKFYAQRLSWRGCADFAVTPEARKPLSSPKLECAYLQVPLDYAAPQGRTIELAVGRQRATDVGKRIGSLVFNPGGPGVSALGILPSIASRVGVSQVGRRFDLVAFDPRGVGASKPPISCLTDGERDAMRLDVDVDPSPAGVAQTEAENRDFASKCAAKTGPELLGLVGTRDVVKDIDVLRSALGEAKLNYLGYSYGTRIGYSYAEAFGGNVRTMVLDGALDPEKGLIDRAVAQARGFQGAFDAFARWCAQRACPLGTDPANAVGAFQALVRPLIDAPAAGRDGRRLSYPDAITGVIQALYTEQLWESLRRGLLALAGGDGSPLLLLADNYEGRSSDGSYAKTLEAFTAIGCVDDPPVTDPAQLLEADKRAREASPFRDDGRGASAAKDPCGFWPVPPTGKAHKPTTTSLPQIVVISVTGDPATPYQAGVDLATALGARLLSVEGNQHTVALQGEACVDKAVSDYLINLIVPPEGTRCRIG